MALPKKLLTTEQLADLLSVSQKTVWKLCREQKIPHHKIERSYRFTESDVMTILGATAVDPDAVGPVPVGRRP